MTITYFDIIGWMGALSVLYAYFMVSMSKLKGDSIHFQAANIFGAVCLGIHTFSCQAYPSTVVNIIWVGIAIYTLTGKKRMNV